MPGIMDLIWPGAFVVQSIHVVARLGIADILGPEPRTVEDLASAVDAHAPSLRRVLRALTTLGVIRTGGCGGKGMETLGRSPRWISSTRPSPCGTSRAGIRLILGEPMNAATKVLAGRL